MPAPRALCALVGALWLAAGRAPAPAAQAEPTAELAIGEVADHSAVVWARCAPPSALHVHLDGREGDLGRAVETASDGTAHIALAALSPASGYRVRAWCGADDGSARVATFRTAPAPEVAAPLRFAFGGDVGGQNVCRDAQRGYPIFTHIAARRPDFFIGLGDMIYADDACLPLGRYGNAQIPGPPPATDLSGFRAHWRYNRADPAFADLLAQVPLIAVWDDHEIINDAGPRQAAAATAPGVDLLPPALRAFLEYQPLRPPADDPTRLYRRLRWGRHAELFLLDTRQYRSANSAPDGAGKTMLGTAQLAWLADALQTSDATWK
ncbi:MAG: alkaline phosphatase D family protein, partial [Candidatus Binatia bacterium]